MSKPVQRSAFRQDPKHLARMAENLEDDTRLAREEAVGAELLYTRDLIANLGIFWDTAEQLGDLCIRQVRQFAEDNMDTLSALLESHPGEVPNVVGRHLERRMRHVGQGFEESMRLLTAQYEKTGQTLFRIWTPFAAVVRQDWASRSSRRTR